MTQPRDLLCGAANVVLAVLKSNRLQDVDRHRKLESLLQCTITDERFEFYTKLGEKFNDWGSEANIEGG